MRSTTDFSIWIEECRLESLLNFLSNRGVSLQDYGSNEYGVDLVTAKEFLALLHSQDGRILGMEVWMALDGRYSIDSLAGWYAIGGDGNSDFHDARQFLDRLENNCDRCAVTIQFAQGLLQGRSQE